MNQEQGSRKYINIPGSTDFVFDFKFDLTLPTPISQPKSLYYPLDPDRYTKPKLTLLHVQKKPILYNDVTLGIPVDEINMMPELYNPDPNQKAELSQLDREILENAIEEPKIQQVTESKTRNLRMKQASSFYLRESTMLSKTQGTFFGKGTHSTGQEALTLSGSYQKNEEPEEIQVNVKTLDDLKNLVDNQFNKAGLVDNRNLVAPNRNSRVKKVYKVLPNFQDYLLNFQYMKAEASQNILKNKKILIHEAIDKDKQKIVSLYAQKSVYDELDIEKGKEPEKEDDKKAAPKRNSSRIMDEEEAPKKADDSDDEFKDLMSDSDNGDKKSNDDKMEEENKAQKDYNPYENLEVGPTTKLNDEEMGLLKKITNYEHKGNYVYTATKASEMQKREFLLRLPKSDKTVAIHNFETIFTIKRKKLTGFRRDELDENPQAERLKLAEVYFRKFTKEELTKGLEVLSKLHVKRTPAYRKLEADLKDNNYHDEADNEDFETLKILLTRMKEEKDARDGVKRSNEEEDEPKFRRNDDDDEEEEDLDDFIDEDNRDLAKDKHRPPVSRPSKDMEEENSSDDASFDIEDDDE